MMAMPYCSCLHDILLELGRHRLQQLGSNAGNLVLVRATLKSREHSVVDLRGEVALILWGEGGPINRWVRTRRVQFVTGRMVP